MDTNRKNEIWKTAQNVSRTSEQFQLIHATYACQMLIKQVVMKDYKKKYDELSGEIERKINNGVNYEKEQEASCFGDKLLELRKTRNEKIYQDGGAHKQF